MRINEELAPIEQFAELHVSPSSERFRAIISTPEMRGIGDTPTRLRVEGGQKSHARNRKSHSDDLWRLRRRYSNRLLHSCERQHFEIQLLFLAARLDESPTTRLVQVNRRYCPSCWAVVSPDRRSGERLYPRIIAPHATNSGREYPADRNRPAELPGQTAVSPLCVAHNAGEIRVSPQLFGGPSVPPLP